MKIACKPILKACPICAQVLSPTAMKCPFCHNKDLSLIFSEEEK